MNHQPPTATNHQSPTANRQSPPTANRRLPPTMVEHISYTRSFYKTAFQGHFFFPLKDPWLYSRLLDFPVCDICSHEMLDFTSCDQSDSQPPEPMHRPPVPLYIAV